MQFLGFPQHSRLFYWSNKLIENRSKKKLLFAESAEYAHFSRFRCVGVYQPICTKALCSRNEKVTKVSAGPKFSHFPTETYLVIVKYQKFPKSIERNWGFWIIFDLERVGHFFEIKSKDDIQMALLTLTWILILVKQIEI